MNIYKITNLINNKIYIGKEETPIKTYFGSGKLIKRSIIKYGKENFIKEIIDSTSNRYELREKEIFWIKHYNSTNSDIGYNIAKGGDGGQLISNDTLSKNAKELWKNPEYRKKQSISRKGRINWNCGKSGIYSDESRIKMSKKKIGKKHTIEHNNLIRMGNLQRKYITVKCVETNVVYNSINAAIKDINLPSSYKLRKVEKGVPIKIGNLTYVKINNNEL